MQKWLEKFSIHCVQNGIITEDQLPWFIYGIEKRLSTVLISIPFFLLATLLATPQCAVSLFLAFFLLRRRTSGYHAGGIASCLFMSLALEIAFFILIYPLLHLFTIILLLCTCTPIICTFAPYRHPNMQFSDEEVHACQTSSRAIICILAIGAVISYAAGLHEITKGLTIGITMATVLLCTAYVIEWRKNK